MPGMAADDELLPPPGVNHLRADVQIISDLRDRPTCAHQIQDLPPDSAGYRLGTPFSSGC